MRFPSASLNHKLGLRLSTRSRRASSSATINIGIRREDPERLWERRCPLTPEAISQLVEQGVNVFVQDCNRRVFSRSEFIKAGAKVQKSLEPASIILGIKEVPIRELIATPAEDGQPRTHFMFSHTTKGQSYNMPLLSKFLESPSSPRLIDYELLTDGPEPDAKRVVGFGWFAGAAGLVEGLSASALDLLTLGIASPFLHLPRPYANRTLEGMKSSLRSVGEHIISHGTPAAAGPFVIAITGNGNVSRGSLDMLQELPVQYITPQELPVLLAQSEPDLRKVYVVHVSPSSYLFKNDGTPYSRDAYYAHPNDFHSRFYETIAPYISLLVNGAGWKPGYPRLMTNDQLVIALRNAKAVGRCRFRSVSDISCDVEGGLEFLSRSTTLDSPFYISRPTNLPHDLDGIQIMAVDIIPSELPLDASAHFSNALMPYLTSLIRQKQGHEPMDAAEGARLVALDRATIARGGRLDKRHEWLRTPLGTTSLVSNKNNNKDKNKDLDLDSDLEALDVEEPDTPNKVTLKSRKTVLLFGSGMVAKPAVAEFLKRKDVQLVIASNNLAEAEALIHGHESATVVLVDLADSQQIGKLVSGADVVASLLPASLHTTIATHCINHKKHLVTASYISPAMQELNQSAIDADVLLLNEIGLDPGLDHLSAMELKDRMQSQGKRVVSFISWCGGLPAPEDSNVPLGMKFSWSPKGLLGAALNSAQFKLANQKYSIPGERLLSSYFPHVPLAKGFALEGLANRDSLSYAGTYGLGHIDNLESIFRGTLRYKGFAELLHSFRALGLLSLRDQDRLVLKNWTHLGAAVLGKLTGDNSLSTADVHRALAQSIGSDTSIVVEALETLSILPPSSGRSQQGRQDLPALPASPQTPLDLLTILLAHKLRYRPGERDMVILSHEIITVPLDANQAGPGAGREVHTSTLVTYGDDHTGSAMSVTVGLPLAFATLRVLGGEVLARGVRAPVDSEVYRPVLADLEVAGLVMKEATGRVGMAQGLVQGIMKV